MSCMSIHPFADPSIRMHAHPLTHSLSPSFPPPPLPQHTHPTAIPCDLIHSQSCFWTNVAVSAGFLNLCLFLFNLFIPAYPLDASRILVDLFALCKVEVNRAALITAGISVPIGMGLLAYGFWAFAKGAANYSMTIFLAIFILYSTWGVFKAARAGNAARHPMFVHYYRQSDPTPAPATSTTAAGRIASLWGGGAGASTGAPGTGGPGASSGSTFSNMEAGKGHRLGGKAAPSAAAPAVGGRSTSQSALLGGSSSSNVTGAAASSSSASSKGYKLGSK